LDGETKQLASGVATTLLVVVCLLFGWQMDIFMLKGRDGEISYMSELLSVAIFVYKRAHFAYLVSVTKTYSHFTISGNKCGYNIYSSLYFVGST